MRRTTLATTATVLLIGTLAFVGCNSQDGASPESRTPTSTTDASMSDVDPKINAALAQLSPEDRAAAEQQKICPVTGEPLGSMGKPIKVTVKGQEVFLCCEACRERSEAEPDKYLAKLK